MSGWLRVRTKDLPRAKALLQERRAEAMFPLSNLERYGLDGDAPYAMRLWRRGENLLGLTRSGTVMPCGSGPWQDAAIPLEGAQISAVIGAQPAARAVVAALGCQGQPATLDRDEPHYLCRLDQLALPDGPGALVPLKDAPRALLLQWLADYQTEALGTEARTAQRRALDDLERYQQADSHRVLMVEGRACAMTGINARAGDMVQVGGVYTPPDLRGRGHARRAVALHLQEHRRTGTSAAVLFAANVPAQRAYEAIGFRQIGLWCLLLLADPLTVSTR